MRMLAIGVLAVALLASVANAEEICVVGFNIERGFKSDADLATISAQMAEYASTDLWGISESDKNGATVRPGESLMLAMPLSV